MNKDTVYIDVDDEITSIIEKVQGSQQKVVALVLPKRATTLQSIVNMKLLKRAAQEAKKQVVLVTTEAGLLPLAGAVGVHVASNLQSKPSIPKAPDTPALADTVMDVSDQPDDAELDASRPVGELAGLPADSTPAPSDSAPKRPSGASGPKAAPPAATPAAKNKQNKKLKVPNFNTFRKRLLLAAVVLVALLVGWAVAATVLPRARVVIKTDAADIASNVSFTADTQVDEFDESEAVLPAASEELKKTNTAKVAATGQKNLGTKAGGEVTLSTPCSPTAPSIPAGTCISSGSLTFITQETVILATASFSGTNCNFTDTVQVIAQNPGDQFNIGAGRSFAVSGYSNVTGNNAAAFAGGTNRVVKVVSSQDVESAKSKLTSEGSDDAEDELKEKLKDENYRAITETLTTGQANITSSPAVDSEANEVTVTSQVTYTMLGVKEDDLKRLVEADIKKQIDGGRQSILDNGLGRASFRLGQKKTATTVALSVQSQAQVGPQLNTDDLKRDIAGKKKGEVINLIRGRPGVNDVEVNYSPFWVVSAPKAANKITVTVQKADGGN